MFTEHKHGPYPPWPPCSGSLCTVLRKRTAFHPLSPYSSAIQKKGEGDEGGQNQGGILLFGTCYFFKCKKRERNSIKKRGEKYYAALSPCIVLLPSPFSLLPLIRPYCRRQWCSVFVTDQIQVFYESYHEYV